MDRTADDGPAASSASKRPPILSRLLLVQVGITALVLVGLLMPIPEMGNWLRAATDLLHAPLFALLAIVLLSFLRRFGIPMHGFTCLAVWVFLTTMGGLIEVAQLLVDRHATLKDGIANAGGAAAGVLWMTAFVGSTSQPHQTRERVKIWLLSIGGIILLVGCSYESLRHFIDVSQQRLQMPLIASFEYDADAQRWRTNDSRISRSQDFVTDGEWSLQIDLQPGTYPGISLEPAPNWFGYGDLVIDTYLEGDAPLNLVVKVYDSEHDKTHRDRFHHRALLRPGYNEIRIGLGDVAFAPETREMDLRRIQMLHLFCVRLSSERTLYVDHIRLEF